MYTCFVLLVLLCFMSLCMCALLYVSKSVCILYASPCVCMSVCMYLFIALWACMSVCTLFSCLIYLCLHYFMFSFLSVCRYSVYVFVCGRVCMSCLSVSITLCVGLSGIQYSVMCSLSIALCVFIPYHLYVSICMDAILSHLVYVCVFEDAMFRLKLNKMLCQSSLLAVS